MIFKEKSLFNNHTKPTNIGCGCFVEFVTGEQQKVQGIVTVS
jgi:hypothetical protein